MTLSLDRNATKLSHRSPHTTTCLQSENVKRAILAGL